MFLASDAAHVNTPIGAQGLNTGVMDAVNLGWKLAWALRHGASERLLDSYHEERHPVVLRMFRANDRLTRMVFGRNPILRGLARRQLCLLEVPSLNLRNTESSAQLSVGYRSSSVVLGAGELRGLDRLRRLIDGSVECGDRLPCAELDAGEWLYDRLDGSRHSLVVVDDGRGRAASWAERVAEAEAGGLNVLCVREGRADRGEEPGRVRRVRDPRARIAEALGLQGGGAVLVRPDAFVAAQFGLGDDEHARCRSRL